MHVHSIQSDNYKSYNSPKFGELNVTEAGTKMINSWYGSEAVWQKINTWKKELVNTERFNLTIDELCNGLFMLIEDKTSNYRSCEAPLRVCDEPQGKEFWAFGTDLIDCGDWVSYPLEFKSCQEAEEAYTTLKKYQHGHSMPTIKKIEWAVNSLKILEKGTGYPTSSEVADMQGISETNNAELTPWRRFVDAFWALFK